MFKANGEAVSDAELIKFGYVKELIKAENKPKPKTLHDKCYTLEALGVPVDVVKDMVESLFNVLTEDFDVPAPQAGVVENIMKQIKFDKRGNCNEEV